MKKLQDIPDVLISARREVILSAGAVNTPWLLMLSGVGPKKHLEEMKIPVVKDLPGVGQNLQDHIMVYGPIFNCKPGKSVGFTDSSVLVGLKAMMNYILFGKGIGAFPYVQGLAFLRSGLLDEMEANDLEIHFVPFLGHDEAQLERNFLLTKDQCAAFDVEKKFDDYGVTFLPTLLLPQSSGTIKLKSKDPTEYPAIDPQYLKMEHDIEVLVRGFKFCRKMARTKAFADLLGEEVIDDSIPHDPQSDEYIRELVRRAVITVYHPVGTAKMGPTDDPDTVCDPTLKVKGLKNIRIADASIMPSVPSANTNAPCIMVGEKASDLIKADARETSKVELAAEIRA